LFDRFKPDEIPMQNNSTRFDRIPRNRLQSITRKQRAVLEFIQDRGASGATDKQIQAGLNMCGDTQRPRRRELERAGLIREAEHPRNGCKVWVAIGSAKTTPQAAQSQLPAFPIVNGATNLGSIRQRQVEATQSAADELNAAWGGSLDAMTSDEIIELIANEADEVTRDGLQRRFEKLGAESGFVRPYLLRLLQKIATPESAAESPEGVALNDD
jgi:hypothetical protein